MPVSDRELKKIVADHLFRPHLTAQGKFDTNQDKLPRVRVTKSGSEEWEYEFARIAGTDLEAMLRLFQPGHPPRYYRIRVSEMF